MATSHTAPDIFVVNLVRVFGRDINFAAINWMVFQCCSAFKPPLLEACTMRLIVNIGDHVVGEVTVFVSKGIDQSIFVIDNTFG